VRLIVALIVFVLGLVLTVEFFSIWAERFDVFSDTSALDRYIVLAAVSAVVTFGAFVAVVVLAVGSLFRRPENDARSDRGPRA
jgi:hypothetical protein